jgi:hypothetical protein
LLFAESKLLMNATGACLRAGSLVAKKVLVCLLASTRAHQLTFPSFKRQVLDESNGDLALAL